MAEETTEGPPPKKGGKKLGGLPPWQWAMLAVAGGGLIFLLIKNRGAAASGATNAGSAAATPDPSIDPSTGAPWGSGGGSETGNPSTLQPIVDQAAADNPTLSGTPIPGVPMKPPQGPGTTSSPTPPKTTAGTPNKGTVATPKPTAGVGTRINPNDFPKNVLASTAIGKGIVSFATVQNGRIVGKNVGQSGAPVFALVRTGYGPVWQQGFNPAKLPNGTKVGTLPQFKAKISGAKKVTAKR